MGCHLHLDPFAGISGDMFVGACLDLGVELEALEAALRPLPLKHSWALGATATFRHSIRGLDFKVHVGDSLQASPEAAQHHAHDHTHAHAHEHSHAHDRPPIGSAHLHPDHTGYTEILSLIEQLEAPERARERARAILKRLGEGEARVHGVPLEQVHFHEVGAVDSILDMLGAAVVLEALDVESISSAALPVGRGFVQCDHGNMPLPAPATAEILRGVPHYGVEREFETVTPTGAAIVAALATQFGPQPPMRVEKIGYGAGDRDPADVPNLLRVYLGERLEG